MTTKALEREFDRETERDILMRRFRRLREAGYPATDAVELAARGDIDLGLAVRLVRDGCSPKLALRILF